MNKLDLDYQNLLEDILTNGTYKQTRNGKTLSVFGRQIRHKMSDGFPLLTTKKMPFKTITTELLWFLRGDTNIKYLVNNGCNVWNGDAYKNYVSKVEKYTSTLNVPDDISEFQEVMDLVGDQMKSSVLTQEEFINKIKTDDEFAKKWGELGPIYGAQWRSWNGIDKEAFFNSDNLDERNKDARYGVFYKESEIDQIQNLINELQTNPDSRRLMVSAWNVADLPNQVLPPCHYGFQVYTRELSLQERFDYYTKNSKNTMSHHKLSEHVLKNTPTRAISLMFNMRSNDVPLGLPFNIASYGLLLEIFGKMVNMVPDELIANLGDAHIYKNQIDGVNEQLTREPYQLPQLEIAKDVVWKDGDCLPHYEPADFKLVDYQSHPVIKIPLSN